MSSSAFWPARQRPASGCTVRPVNRRVAHRDQCTIPGAGAATPRPSPFQERAMPDVDDPQLVKIKTYATTRSSQSVGSGECFDLADQALKDAGAKSAADYGKVTPTADYKWGRKINATDAKPGDVVQYKDYKVEIKVTTVTTNADGSSETSFTTETQTRPHHTAVVSTKGGDGAMTVLEQNVDGDRTVKERPLPAASSKKVDASKSGTSTVTVTTEVKVTGEAKVYRPEKK
jgi:hypothetical protein